MFDLASYYAFCHVAWRISYELERTEKEAIEAELALQLTDPSRGPHDGNSEPVVVLKRRRVSRCLILSQVRSF